MHGSLSQMRRPCEGSQKGLRRPPVLSLLPAPPPQCLCREVMSGAAGGAAQLRRLPCSHLSWWLFLASQGLWNFLQTESNETDKASLNILQHNSFQCHYHVSCPCRSTSLLLTLARLRSGTHFPLASTSAPNSGASVRTSKALWFFRVC